MQSWGSKYQFMVMCYINFSKMKLMITTSLIINSPRFHKATNNLESKAVLEEQERKWSLTWLKRNLMKKTLSHNPSLRHRGLRRRLKVGLVVCLFKLGLQRNVLLLIRVGNFTQILSRQHLRSNIWTVIDTYLKREDIRELLKRFNVRRRLEWRELPRCQ